MADDTPKWDCDIGRDYDDCYLQDNNFDVIDTSQEKYFIGKTIRLLKDAEMTPNARYYDEDNIYNDWFGAWGYVDRFMFELIPNSMYLDKVDNETHLGKLIAVLDKEK